MASSSTYQSIRDDFDREALKKDGMFSKNLTECDRKSIEYLKRLIKPTYKVLEIGCGMGNVIEKLNCERHGIDISPNMIAKCENVYKMVGDMDNLPYEDDQFDLVYMIMTLQQSLNRDKTLSEMKRVTKKRGLMVIIDGDRNSIVGKSRQKSIKQGEWKMCGKAEWLSKDDFPAWKAEHLAPHILVLSKTK
jgi:ubiquinone/menaquinone biosynthesis C-methylase UbiE